MFAIYKHNIQLTRLQKVYSTSKLHKSKSIGQRNVQYTPSLPRKVTRTGLALSQQAKLLHSSQLLRQQDQHIEQLRLQLDNKVKGKAKTDCQSIKKELIKLRQEITDLKIQFNRQKRPDFIQGRQMLQLELTQQKIQQAELAKKEKLLDQSLAKLTAQEKSTLQRSRASKANNGKLKRIKQGSRFVPQRERSCSSSQSVILRSFQWQY